MKIQLENYFDRLWPITRSLTGNGNRETFAILSELVDLTISEVPSGTPCFDWNIPPEWNVREAWIKDENGRVVLNFQDNNLHLLGYSEPFHGSLSFDELKSHLFTLPEQPDLIPYLTSYYKRRWGFCLSQNQFSGLDAKGTYEVFIDSTLDETGSMTMGEAIIKGSSDREILFSTYICHPSLANNELSGPLVTAFLYSKLKERKNLKFTYRFAFVPETIGTIYYLSSIGDHLRKCLIAGYVVTCIGDHGGFTYKKSRRGNSLADRAAQLILNQCEIPSRIVEFVPRGSDERQYCSPGFDLPVGSLMRTMYGMYPEYHTSADNKEFISFDAMEKSVLKFLEIVELIEQNEIYYNTLPYGEPHLGKRGLYPTLGSSKDTSKFLESMMWILNLADGTNDLITICEKSNIPVNQAITIVNQLLEKKILERMNDSKIG